MAFPLNEIVGKWKMLPGKIFLLFSDWDIFWVSTSYLIKFPESQFTFFTSLNLLVPTGPFEIIATESMWRISTTFSLFSCLRKLVCNSEWLEKWIECHGHQLIRFHWINLNSKPFTFSSLNFLRTLSNPCNIRLIHRNLESLCLEVP